MGYQSGKRKREAMVNRPTHVAGLIVPDGNGGHRLVDFRKEGDE
jgi:hypothetical protein